MIKSIASLSKDNVPSLMTNNALYYLSNNKWLLLSTDNVVKVEFDQDSNVWDSECITFRGKNVGLLQYLELKDLQVVVLGLDNDITISDLNNVHLFHTSLDSEMASCAFIQSDSNNDPQIFIGTTLGRILRINEKDSDWKLNEEFRIDTNIWTIGQFKDFLVLSLESGTLEFWKNTGSWDRVAVNESKYPSTCMCVLETEYLVVTRLHGNIDILNSDLTTLISVGAHTGYISGIAFSSNRFATISMDQLHLWEWTLNNGDLKIESLKTYSFPGYCFCGISFKDKDIIMIAAGEYDFLQIDSSHF